MNKEIYEQIFTVNKKQTDWCGRLKISELARQMEEVTTKHLEQFGLTRETLEADGLIWVIAWNDIQIESLPQIGETVSMRVWLGHKKAGMHTRKYDVRTIDGKRLITASALFILMDKKTRTYARDIEAAAGICPAETDVEVPLPKLTTVFPRQLARCEVRRVQPDEIDKNGHMNNACYLDWAEALTGIAHTADGQPIHVWVQYIKELLVGQQVKLEYACVNHTLYIRGSLEQTVFQMMIEGGI